MFEFLGVDPDVKIAPQKRGVTPEFTNPVTRWFFTHPGATRHLSRTARRVLLRGPKKPHKAPPMDAATRARLAAYFRPWNEQLEGFLGRELGWS